MKSLTKSDAKLLKQGQLDQATSKFRPWIKLYHELKWLNSFALTNDVAMQNALKIFQQNVFLVD